MSELDRDLLAITDRVMIPTCSASFVHKVAPESTIDASPPGAQGDVHELGSRLEDEPAHVSDLVRSLMASSRIQAAALLVNFADAALLRSLGLQMGDGESGGRSTTGYALNRPDGGRGTNAPESPDHLISLGKPRRGTTAHASSPRQNGTPIPESFTSRLDILHTCLLHAQRRGEVSLVHYGNAPPTSIQVDHQLLLELRAAGSHPLAAKTRQYMNVRAGRALLMVRSETKVPADLAACVDVSEPDHADAEASEEEEEEEGYEDELDLEPTTLEVDAETIDVVSAQICAAIELHAGTVRTAPSMLSVPQMDAISEVFRDHGAALGGALTGSRVAVQAQVTALAAEITAEINELELATELDPSIVHGQLEAVLMAASHFDPQVSTEHRDGGTKQSLTNPAASAQSPPTPEDLPLEALHISEGITDGSWTLDGVG
ncbi:hypothetical protein P8C59_006941 [Phyllachora maydis]|uniref:Uncharacterized protein n=1 Tax=Phyllachora maydis TaxID=1825666 RepID=A0AAD9I7Q1_9PEZI|nr:hypothetical protein P8C59_006941 [Phyllachora maydis]